MVCDTKSRPWHHQEKGKGILCRGNNMGKVMGEPGLIREQGGEGLGHRLNVEESGRAHLSEDLG